MRPIQQSLFHLVQTSRAPSIIQNECSKLIRNGFFTKSDNVYNHICVFFLPIHIPSYSIFLVHHKKAKDWIPPGGHIEKDELPTHTIQREFYEELGFHIKQEKVDFFTLSVKCITQKSVTCRIHYDFWYVISMKEKTHFSYSSDEFFKAQWIPQSQLFLTTERDYRSIEQQICQRYFV